MMLTVENLSVSYGGIQAVRSASLKVTAGAVTSIIGRNGSGKSSLVGGIAGLIPTAGGSVCLDGKDLSGQPAWRRARAGISLVPEDRRIFASLTVRENLELAAEGTPAERRASLAKVLDLFPDISRFADRHGDRISGGQQQMVAIGRALMRRPRLLILDEPSLGLAPLVVAEVFRAIQHVANEGQSVLLIEQNAPAALAISARAYAMSVGSLRQLTGDLNNLNSAELFRMYL